VFCLPVCFAFVFTSVDLLTGALSANLVAVAVGPGDNSKFIIFTKKISQDWVTRYNSNIWTRIPSYKFKKASADFLIFKMLF
jgi:hypothetical protein